MATPKEVQGMEKIMSLLVRGKFGAGNGFGQYAIGYTFFAETRLWGGMYQRARGLKGWVEYRRRIAYGSNPRTGPQQAWRAVFAAGKAQWDTLTAPEKAAYNIRARRGRMTGFNLHMREYLSAHRL